MTGTAGNNKKNNVSDEPFQKIKTEILSLFDNFFKRKEKGALANLSYEAAPL